jgi:SAM-dependent methyltransferase
MESYYEEKYYDADAGTAARLILPFVVNRYKPASMIDIGCGNGAWLAEAKKLGVENVLGIDGPHVKNKLIEDAEFLTMDLREGFPVFPRNFDVSLCLEVAEHFPADLSESIADDLSKYSRTLIFSAAIPGQAGRGHLNMQWQTWWAEKFRRRGFKALDWLRGEIWDDDRIQSFYRQNIIAFEYCPESPYTIFQDVVHPDFYRYKLEASGVRGWGI